MIYKEFVVSNTGYCIILCNIRCVHPKDLLAIDWLMESSSSTRSQSPTVYNDTTIRWWSGGHYNLYHYITLVAHAVLLPIWYEMMR